ncbi:MAG: 1-aminocyclopropane-1-carboxylate deaminase/D-cysteine desulfhydrase [Campylobacteraceae bacterium]|nr:1-aminocyclopropane-1-carboxylate deaminase/D-cysteine desulfhydrase [Campylobacteraceae bacterium]
MLQTPSPFEKHKFKDEIFFIKRDDLLHTDFSGNKARKFEYFLLNDFPEIKKVVSYGSNQSNAMYSLSVLAILKKWKFIYFCDHLPSFLMQSPNGNYKYALKNGMKIFLSKDRQKDANCLKDSKTLIIQEGGRQKEAEIGIKKLAFELIEDIKKQNIKNPYLFLPSGTGTTALFLQKYLPFQVYTCSTVGSDEYLKEQWKMLDEENYPVILSSKKKYHYGKLYLEAYKIWKELKEELGVEFDLLYDPIGWLKFLENKNKLKGTLIYIHQGGIKGNESMKARYERKYDKIRTTKEI